MYTTACTLVLFVWVNDLLVAEAASLNTYVAEDGRSYYSTPLSCNYKSLYPTNYYSRLRSTYVPKDRDCCYLADSRNKCCLQTDNRGIYQGCKCDPNINCDVTTTTTVPTTTLVTTTSVTTTEPTTTSATTEEPTTASATTTEPTTASATTTEPTTTSATTEEPTTTSATTTEPTTASATTTEPTTACATTTEPTTTSATTVKPTTTSAIATEPTTTPTTSPQGCLPPPLCRSPAFRVLNGESAPSDCPNSGVFKITLPGEKTSTCNAVYTMATVNGVFKPTILTAQICKQFIDEFGTPDSPFEVHIGSLKYNILQPDFTVLNGTSGTAFIDVAQSQSHILDEVGDCQKTTICPYNKNYMQDRVNFKRCKILSWGVSNAEELSQNGLKEVALTINNGGCQDKDKAGQKIEDTLCFQAASGKNLTCSNDSGAPVYCKVFDTDEWILMGVIGTQFECDFTPEVKVLPYPG